MSTDATPRIVGVDANFLIFNRESTGDRRERIDHFLSRIDKAKGKVIIPTPAIAEYLVLADKAGLALLEALQKRASVVVASFDIAAAYEASQFDAAALGRRDKRDGSEEPWQRIKIDRQIVAIAKTHGAKLIVSDDSGVRDAAARAGIPSSSVDELPLPDHARQKKLPIADATTPNKQSE